MDADVIKEAVKSKKTVEVRLELTGDVRLCSFHAEYQPENASAECRD